MDNINFKSSFDPKVKMTNDDEITKFKTNDENKINSVTPVTTSFTTGKSCLICRRRKIKCDKTKPICMKCIKHNATMECMYDDDIKVVNKRKKSKAKIEKDAVDPLAAMKNSIANNINLDQNSSELRSQIDLLLRGKPTSQAGLVNRNVLPKKRGRPPVIKQTNSNTAIEKTPLISIPGSNNDIETIYLTETDNLLNKQKIHQLGLNYIPPVMKNMQQNIYKRRYSKILFEEERQELIKQNQDLNQMVVEQQDGTHSMDAIQMISDLQRDQPGKISGKFADLSIIVQKRIKRQRLLKELSSLKKQLDSMESLICGSIQEEEMDLEELELKFGRFNPREYDVSNPNSPISNINDPNYHIFTNISKMSFYDGFEQVTVFNGRLNFTAPLSAQVVLKKDPYGKVVSIMVEKTLHEYAKTLEVKKSGDKYAALRVTDSNSLPNLISTANNSTRIKRKNTRTGSVSSKKSSNTTPLENSNNSGLSTIIHDQNGHISQTKDNLIQANEQVIEEQSFENDDDDDDDSHEEEANEMFNKQFLENEGIEEMKAVVKEGKLSFTETLTTINSRNSQRFSELQANNESGSNKFSTSNLREELTPVTKKPKLEGKEHSQSIKPESKSKSSLQPENDPVFWSNLNKVLKNIDAKDQNNASNSNQTRAPEGLFGSESSFEHELVLQIQDILPPGKIINIHCKNFFKSPIHGLYPIINEDWWMDTMHRLLGFSETQLKSDLPPKVNIFRRFDIAKLATLLVIMRLSYLGSPETLQECKTEEEKLVLKYPIGKEFINLAQRSLNIFKMLRKGILPVLHCALLLRVYRKYAPEEGDMVDGSDSETFTGFLVKISTSIGLNTDVSRSSWVKNQEMYVDQWRKCWYCVYFFDFMESCNLGNTSSIDIDSFDTKLPEFKLDPLSGTYPTHVIDSRLEDIIVNNYQKNFETTLIARELLSCITNKRLKFAVPNLQMLLNNLNGSIEKNFGKSLKDIIDLDVVYLADSVYKLNSFIWFIELKIVQFYCYIHIFIHIDEQIHANLETILNQDQLPEKLELFHFYLKKIIEIYVEIEPVLVLCYDSSKVDSIFGRGSKFIVIQACENLCIRFIPGLHVIVSRFLHFKFNYLDVAQNPDSNLFKISEDIINCLMDKLSHSGGVCRLLSKKYFQMWRISQSNQFLFFLLNKSSDDNLLKKDSKINNIHREDWQYQNGSQFEHFYPYKSIPMYNLLTGYQLNHFQEIFSILNSVKWNVFSSFYTESELKQGIHFRDKQYETAFQKFLKKNGNSNRRSRKNNKNKNIMMDKSNVSPENLHGNRNSVSSTNLTATPLDDMHKNKEFFNKSRESTSAANSIDSNTNNQNIMIDEIDKYWYDNYLSNNQGMFSSVQPTQNYQSLDDLFDGTNQQLDIANEQNTATDIIKHQVIEKLSNLVPDETERRGTPAQEDSNKINEDVNNVLNSFLFNSGSGYYSDEVNF
ncbi:hypothetical protein QEN19_003394 [Hanseniaspora menglaensis]